MQSLYRRAARSSDYRSHAYIRFDIRTVNRWKQSPYCRDGTLSREHRLTLWIDVTVRALGLFRRFRVWKRDPSWSVRSAAESFLAPKEEQLDLNETRERVCPYCRDGMISKTDTGLILDLCSWVMSVGRVCLESTTDGIHLEVLARQIVDGERVELPTSPPSNDQQVHKGVARLLKGV